MIARYDFATQLNSFDYYGWQAMEAACGATEIVFDTRMLKDRRRFLTIIQPGPAMLGLTSRIGTDGEGHFSSRLRELAPFMRYGRPFPRLHSVKPPGTARYTVTMRQQAYKPERNSDEKVWRTFADEIGAVVIEDYDVAEMHVHDRMALYAGARMNFGVVSGPLVMCQLSKYPSATFGLNWCWGNGFYEKAGIVYGEAMPWLGPNQYSVWEQPTLDLLRRWFDDWSSNANDGNHCSDVRVRSGDSHYSVCARQSHERLA